MDDDAPDADTGKPSLRLFSAAWGLLSLVFLGSFIVVLVLPFGSYGFHTDLLHQLRHGPKLFAWSSPLRPHASVGLFLLLASGACATAAAAVLRPKARTAAARAGVVVGIGCAALAVTAVLGAQRELPFCPQARPPSHPPSPPGPLSLDERELARAVAVNDDTVKAIANGQSIRSWGEVGSSYDPLTGAPEATVNVTWAEPTSAPARLFRSYGPKGAGSLDKTGSFDGVTGVITTVRLSDRQVIRILPWGGTAHGLSKAACSARD